jgi:hypothetical protein
VNIGFDDLARFVHSAEAPSANPMDFSNLLLHVQQSCIFTAFRVFGNGVKIKHITFFLKQLDVTFKRTLLQKWCGVWVNIWTQNQPETTTKIALP